MSIKSTQHIDRKQALERLLADLPRLSNKALGDILDVVAESEETGWCSRFDNFLVDGQEPGPDQEAEGPADETFFWIICYPGGNMSEISVAELQHSMDYEIDQYRRVSEKRYGNRRIAVRDARALAERFGLLFVPSEEEDGFLA